VTGKEQAFVAAFREELEKFGWAESRNIRIDTRWPAADTELMQRFAKELVALQPDLILSNTTPTTTALVQQTRTLPIVFVLVADPIGSGFVASFVRPGGNVTGFIFTEPTMASKWLELLKEIAPGVTRVAMVFNPPTATYAEYWLEPFKAAAVSFAVEAIVAPVRDSSELESVIAAVAREPNGALIAMPNTFMDDHRVAIVDRLSDFFLGLNFNRLLRPARAPRPESPKEKAELQKRVNSLVDKWAVQHAERLKAAKRRRTQSK
jgi:putative tryptophan/tyrosine transport system substrate-binding protein